MSSSDTAQLPAPSRAPLPAQEESDDAAAGDYAARLSAALESPTKRAHADEGDDDDFGEFVYAGRDARAGGGDDEEGVGAYEDRLREVVGSSAGSDGTERVRDEALARTGDVGARNGAKEEHHLEEGEGRYGAEGVFGGRGSTTPPPAGPPSHVTSASNDEFPAIRMGRNGPTRTRSSLGSLAFAAAPLQFVCLSCSSSRLSPSASRPALRLEPATRAV